MTVRILLRALLLVVSVGAAHAAAPYDAALFTLPTPGAKLFDIDFRDNWDSRFADTRSSSAWDYNSSGAIAAFATAAPARPAYFAGAGVNSGLGIWEARTNFCLNSEAPATQTRSLALGTYLIWLTGSGSVTVSGSGIATTTVTQGQPYSFTVNATTSIGFAVAGTVGFLQCEKTSSGIASPPIVTGSGNVARVADFVSAGLSSLGLSNGATLVIDFMAPAFSSIANQTVAEIDDGTTNNRVVLYLADTNADALTVDLYVGGELQRSSLVAAGAPAPGQYHRVALAFGRGGTAIALDGGYPFAASYGNALAPTQLVLGANANGATVLDGYIQRVQAYRGVATDPLLSQLSAPAQSNPAPTYRYLGAMGQSLAVGGQGIPVITTAPPYPACAQMLNDGEVDNGQFFPYGVRGRGLEPVNLGLITGLTGAYEIEGPSAGTVGETHMTAMMAELCDLITANSSQTQTFIGRSDGAVGQDLASISKGASITGCPPSTSGSAVSTDCAYANGYTELSRAVLIARANGGAVEAPVVTFIHGEADRSEGTDCDTYRQGVIQLIENLNTDWLPLTGQVRPVLLFESQLSANSSGQGSCISQAQYDAALTPGLNSQLIRMVVPRYIFPPDTATGTADDGLHLASSSYDWMGEYFGKAIYQELIEGMPFEPLYPLSIGFNHTDHSKIEAIFAVPAPPLVLDTTSIGQGAATNDGFGYADDDSSASVTGVTLTAPDTVEIQLNAVPTGANPKLQYAYNGPGFADHSYFGAWGNLRDSDATVSRLGNPLYNWCLTFDLPVSQ